MSFSSLHYKDKHLFPRQRDSDTSIDLLCNILQVRTDEINIIASAKGQVMGALWYDVAYFDGDEVKDEQKERKVDKADCSAGAVITPFTHHITGESRAAHQLPPLEGSGASLHARDSLVVSRVMLRLLLLPYGEA